jgi:hypothetical protein
VLDVPMVPAVPVVSHAKQLVQLWHKRLGHVGIHRFQNTMMGASGMPKGLKQDHMYGCKVCAMGKLQKAPPKVKAIPKETVPLHRVYSDLAGPFPRSTLNGHTYLINFVDGCSGYSWVYGLQ